MDPRHGPQAPNSTPWQVCVPSVQAPTPRLPGGPRKQRSTAPGTQLQYSSTLPSQLSSRPLPVPSGPQSSTSAQPTLVGSAFRHADPTSPGMQMPEPLVPRSSYAVPGSAPSRSSATFMSTAALPSPLPLCRSPPSPAPPPGPADASTFHTFN